MCVHSPVAFLWKGCHFFWCALLAETLSMSLEQTACEDLKAFERRLTEVIGYLNPQTKRWRIILFISSICTAIGAWQWLMDPVTSQATFVQSLMNHMFFTISSIILVILFLMGIHKRVVTPSIIVSRVRNVLSDFNMSCDDGGRLILRPRPTTSWWRSDSVLNGADLKAVVILRP